MWHGVSSRPDPEFLFFDTSHHTLCCYCVKYTRLRVFSDSHFPVIWYILRRACLTVYHVVIIFHLRLYLIFSLFFKICLTWSIHILSGNVVWGTCLLLDSNVRCHKFLQWKLLAFNQLAAQENGWSKETGEYEILYSSFL